MKLKVLASKPIISFVVVWFLVFLGVMLRGFKADVYPVDNNDDGLHYAWAGITFWDNPLEPVTHSIFATNNPALIWRSQYMDYIPVERFGMKIVRPWMDHPPLGAALIGLPAKLLGYKGFAPIPQMVVRFPAIVASIFTLYLTYSLGKQLFGDRVGKLSLLFLATIPYFVVAHRQSFLENLLTPVFLASLIYLKKSFNASKILAFISGWIKVTGMAIPFMLAGWLFIKKKTKQAWQMVAIGVASIGSYAVYGLLVDKEQFIRTITNQGARGAFVNSFLDNITTVEFYGPFRDGWYVLGFLLSFVLLLKYRQEKFRFFTWFFSAFLIVLFLTSGRMSNSPWYRYPLIPFMSIAIGYFMDRLLKKNDLFLALTFWLFGLTGFDLLKIDISSSLLRLSTLGFIGIYGLKLVFNQQIFKKLAWWTTRIFLLALILLNIYVNLRFSTVHCSYERCLAPTKIKISQE